MHRRDFIRHGTVAGAALLGFGRFPQCSQFVQSRVVIERDPHWLD